MKWGAAAAALFQLALAGCVTGTGDTNPAEASNAAQDNSCESLVDGRRKLSRQIDLAEHTNAAPNSTGGLIIALMILGGTPATMSYMSDYAARQKQSAIGDMRSKRYILDEEIEAKHCTLEARAKAGAPKETADTRFDGVYEGKGQTDSWCAQPSLSFKVGDGHVSGTLRDSESSPHEYEAKGQVYDDGEIALWFKQPGGTDFTDDADGRLEGGVLNFVAHLDTSPKACTYRFSVERSP